MPSCLAPFPLLKNWPVRKSTGWTDMCCWRTRATGRMLDVMVREADVGSPQVSGIEVIDAVEAFEAAAEKSDEARDVCYSHWANLTPEQLHQEFLDCEKQLLRDIRGGVGWLESELKNYPAVDIEMEYGVMGR